MWVVLSGAVAGLAMPYLLTSVSPAARALTIAAQLIPPIGLYSGLFELSQYSFLSGYSDKAGLTFSAMMHDRGGVMLSTLTVFAVESTTILTVMMFGPTAAMHMKNLLGCFQRCRRESKHGSSGCDSSTAGEDVKMEEERAAQALAVHSGRDLPSHPTFGIVTHELHKTYNATFSKRQKVACQSLSLCLPHGECFGLLGPNGAVHP